MTEEKHDTQDNQPQEDQPPKGKKKTPPKGLSRIREKAQETHLAKTGANPATPIQSTTPPEQIGGHPIRQVKIGGRELVIGVDGKWHLAPVAASLKRQASQHAKKLDSVEEILACLSFTARCVLRDSIEPKTANTVGYLCGVALRALEIRGSSETAQAVLVKLRRRTTPDPDPLSTRKALDETLLEVRSRDANEAKALLEAVEQAQAKAGRRPTVDDTAEA